MSNTNKVYDITVKIMEGDGSTKAMGSFCCNGFKINYKLIETKDGNLFVALPTQKNEKLGKYFNQVNILDDELKEIINNTVIEAYGRGPTPSKPRPQTGDYSKNSSKDENNNNPTYNRRSYRPE